MQTQFSLRARRLDAPSFVSLPVAQTVLTVLALAVAVLSLLELAIS